jgi:uncharacterized repeat protein (TIGR02543 family)
MKNIKFTRRIKYIIACSLIAAGAVVVFIMSSTANCSCGFTGCHSFINEDGDPDCTRDDPVTIILANNINNIDIPCFWDSSGVFTNACTHNCTETAACVEHVHTGACGFKCTYTCNCLPICTHFDEFGECTCQKFCEPGCPVACDIIHECDSACPGDPGDCDIIHECDSDCTVACDGIHECEHEFCDCTLIICPHVCTLITCPPDHCPEIYCSHTACPADGILRPGWYVVRGSMTRNTSLNIAGNTHAHIILENNSHLTINGSNSDNNAAIGVTEGNSLTISRSAVTAGAEGRLTATARAASSNAAGIGGGSTANAGTITINGGIVTATGNTNGAGIGGGISGSGGIITINGGTISATGGMNAAGIGGGGGSAGVDGGNGSHGGNSGEISISGGTITVGHSINGAGIGGGGGGNSTGVIGGNGGAGGDGGHGENITVTGGTITINQGNGRGAGIGGGNGGISRGGDGGHGGTGGDGGNSGTILISGGTITINGNTSGASNRGETSGIINGAGIGGGSGGSSLGGGGGNGGATGKGGDGNSITINGNAHIVRAIGGTNAAGIGGGGGGISNGGNDDVEGGGNNSLVKNGGNGGIIIIGGNARIDRAEGGVRGAGIGGGSTGDGGGRAGGHGGTGGIITITDDARVTAVGHDGGAGIGGGHTAVPPLNSSVVFPPAIMGNGGEITISGSARVDASARTTEGRNARGGGAGIGGGNGGLSGRILIEGTPVVTAQILDGDGRDGSGGAGIGNGAGGHGGHEATGAFIEIRGGTVTATVALTGQGAAIGGGRHGTGGRITISGGTVVAEVGSTINSSGVAVETAAGSVTYASNGFPASGAGIGGGGSHNDNNPGTGGIITITGGTVTATGGPNGGAGIGGGGTNDGNISRSNGGAGGAITITGGTITARSRGNGAGIGGGGGANGVNGSGSSHGAAGRNAGASGTIVINDGTVTATGSGNGAGIGGGGGGNGGNNGGTTASNRNGGAGGIGGAGTDIRISDTAVVTATGGGNGAGIGGGGGGNGGNGGADAATRGNGGRGGNSDIIRIEISTQLTSTAGNNTAFAIGQGDGGAGGGGSGNTGGNAGTNGNTEPINIIGTYRWERRQNLTGANSTLREGRGNFPIQPDFDNLILDNGTPHTRANDAARRFFDNHSYVKLYQREIKYTINFISQFSDGGGGLLSQTYTYRHIDDLYDEDYRLPFVGTNITRTGYTFRGWSFVSPVTPGTGVLNESLMRFAFGDGAYANRYSENKTVVAEDHYAFNLFAMWTPITYTVEFVGNNNTGGVMTPQTFTYDTPQNLRTNTFIRTGFTFGGWRWDDNGTIRTYTNGQSITNLLNTPGTVTLGAVWNPINYTITFDKNNGTGGSDSVVVTFNSPTGVEMITPPERGAHNFMGYRNAADGVMYFNADGELAEPWRIPNNTTLIAVWEPFSYNITLNHNNGTLNPHAATSAPKTVGQIPADITALPQRTGHDFTGYYSTDHPGRRVFDKDGKIIAGVAGYTDAEGKWINEKDFGLILIAGWDAHTYIITYAPGYDTTGISYGSTAPGEVKHYGNYIPKANGFNRTGYTFKAWEFTRNYTTTEISPGLPGISSVQGYLTLTAVWTPISYTVAFNNNRGSGEMESQTFVYDTPQNLRTNTFTRPGFEFLGWSANEFATDPEFEDEDDEAINLRTTPGTYTLFAIWKIIDYNITYELDGGANHSGNPETYTIEDEITLLTPTKTGYDFTGWVKENGDPFSIIQTGSTGAITVTATWTPTIYNITYENVPIGVNHSGNPASYTIEDDEIILQTPTKTGHNFIRWEDESNAPITSIPQGSTGNKTITAIWTPIEYTVVFDPNCDEVTETKDDKDFVFGVPQYLPPNTFTKYGYAFLGWSFESDAEDPEFANGESVINLTDEDDDVVTLFAVWGLENRHLTVISAGVGSSGTGYYANKATVNISAGTRAGFTFTRWTTSDSGVIFANVNNANTSFVMPNRDVTVEAVFTAIVVPPLPETTPAPVITTPPPVITTPVVVTPSPVVTTARPPATTARPPATAAPPIPSTSAPVTATQSPVTTARPPVTTAAPPVTTAAPPVTTAAPPVTTAAPPITTIAITTVTITQPPPATLAPVITTASVTTVPAATVIITTGTPAIALRPVTTVPLVTQAPNNTTEDYYAYVVTEPEPTAPPPTATSEAAASPPSQAVIPPDDSILGMLVNNTVTPPAQEPPVLEIFGWEMLLFAPLGSLSWSLFNLIIVAFSILFAALSIIRAFFQKKREFRTADEVVLYSDEISKEHQQKIIWLAVSSISGIMGVFLFLIFQNGSYSMSLMDSWTFAHLILLVTEIFAVSLAFKKPKKEVSAILEIEQNAIPVA